MPLPANVTTVTVLGTFLTPEGNPSTGIVTFTPSAWLNNPGANIAIPNSSVSKTLGTAGDFTVLLPVTDDTDLSPENWVYNVSEVIDGVSQNYNILLPGTAAPGGTAFLADLVPAAPAGPEYYSLASSLSIGTVTTVATGGSATATITGLAPSQVLSLGLPTGATGTVASAGSGSVGTAAVAPTGDPNTGIYFPAADQVAITTGGTQALLLAAGAVSNPTFTGTAKFPDGSASAPSITNTGDTDTGVAFPADNTVAVTTGGTERVRVDSSGNVGIGTTSPVFQIDVRASGAANTSVQRSSDNTAAPNIVTRKSRGTSTSPTVVSVNDIVGTLTGFGYDGSTYQNAGAIQIAVDDSPGAGDMPGRLMFFATADGTTTLTERMRIDRNGLITGTGTSLGAWTSYTPTLAGTGWAIGDGTIQGFYSQIGKNVAFRIRIIFGSTSTFGAGEPTVTLPVSTANIGFPIFAGGRYQDISLGASANAAALIEDNGNRIFLRYWNTDNQMTASSSTAPWTWAASDVIIINGVCQAA
jgi:hypothetical protein